MTRPPVNFDLDGKTAIVSGASSGIGAGVAAGLAQSGARVALLGRDAERLDRVRGEIEADGGSAVGIQADLTAPGAAAAAVDTAVEAFGEIDVLVNAAGIDAGGPLPELTPETVEKVLSTNVAAVIELSRAAAARMRVGAAMIFVGTNLAHYSLPGTGVYAASKGAIETFARVMAVELAADGIRVNTISPGPVRTPMIEFITGNAELASTIEGEMPHGRLGEVADVVPAVCFLASSEASGYIAGATIVLDGARSLA